MKKEIEVCDRCQSPNIEVRYNDKVYCKSCALEIYKVNIIYAYRCAWCEERMDARNHAIYVTSATEPIEACCSLQCAVERTEAEGH